MLLRLRDIQPHAADEINFAIKNSDENGMSKTILGSFQRVELDEKKRIMKERKLTCHGGAQKEEREKRNS